MAAWRQLLRACVFISAAGTIACGPDPACPCYPFGGSSQGTTTGPTGTTQPTTATTADLVYCVSAVNAYRTANFRASLARSAALEAYAAEGARIDGTAKTPHLHFQQTSSSLIAVAETEITWLPLRSFGTVQGVIDEGLRAHVAEGPGGANYDTMLNPSYSQLGCGVYIVNGEVTVTLNFR
jgi:hypothetical protein